MSDKPVKSPLAVYRESLPQVSRQLKLFADRIEIDAVWRWPFSKRAEAVVRLGDLSPDFKRRHVRNRWFKNSVLIGSLAVAFALVVAREGYAPFMQRLAWCGWAIGGVCGVVAALCFRRRQFASFAKKDGRPGIDFCDAGPDRASYEAFAAEVRRAIKRAQA